MTETSVDPQASMKGCPMAASAQPAPAPPPRRAPGPRGLGVLGAYARIARDPFAGIENLGRKYGDIVHLPAPAVNVYVVSSSDFVNHVFNRNTARYWHSHDVLDEALLPGGPRALPQLDGQQWKRHRKVMQPPFLEKNLAKIGDPIAEALEDGVTAWESFADTGRQVELQHELGIVVMSALTRSLFATDWDRDRLEKWVDQTRTHAQFAVLGAATYGALHTFSWWKPIYRKTPWRHLRRGRANYQAMKDTIDGLIADRLDNPTEQSDVLNLMLQARFDDGTTFSREELRSEMFAMMFAGFETTAAVLAWVIALLVRNPAQLEAAYAEVDALGGGPIRYENIPSLPFLRACFDEAQRIQAGPANVRIAKHDDEIGGCHIPEGSIVMTSLYAMHHDPRYWTDPKLFKPRRFLEEEVDKYAFIPFGVGPRRCVGIRLAYIEGILALANLLARYRFELPEQWAPQRNFAMSTGLRSLPVKVYSR